MATTIVLIAGLVVRRLVTGDIPPARTEAHAAVAARVPVHTDR